MTNPARIDVHQHAVPTIYEQAVRAAGLPAGWPTAAWSPDNAVAMMDAQGIATGVLSVSFPGVHFGADAPARALARAVNEYCAEVVKDRPDRFGLFSSVPLPDLDGALAEIAHAFDNLNADGVILLTNTQGHYLGDPAYEPLWAELDRRHATVFVHPAQPPMPALDELPVPLADFLLDTTRVALQLTRNRVLVRHPNLKVILAHGGGMLPYMAYRAASLNSTVLEPERTPEEIIADLKRFYFDTALTSSPTALPALLRFAEPGHVLYGSDWPHAPQAAGSYHNTFLDTLPDLTADQRTAINRGSAEVLFPRLVREP